jgi:hypothetical protein
METDLSECKNCPFIMHALSRNWLHQLYNSLYSFVDYQLGKHSLSDLLSFHCIQQIATGIQNMNHKIYNFYFKLAAFKGMYYLNPSPSSQRVRDLSRDSLVEVAKFAVQVLQNWTYFE